jgi:hypothetical protein
VIPFGCQTLFQNVVPSVSFSIRETRQNHRGLSPANSEDVVSCKLCGFQGRVGGRIVVMKEPVLIAPKFWSFSSHIFSQVSQNVALRVRVDRNVRKNRFTVNSPLHIEKNNDHALC